MGVVVHSIIIPEFDLDWYGLYGVMSVPGRAQDQCP